MFALRFHLKYLCKRLLTRISDMIIEGGLKELLPEARDVKDAFSYYTAKLTGAEAPPQGKYLE